MFSSVNNSAAHHEGERVITHSSSLFTLVARWKLGMFLKDSARRSKPNQTLAFPRFSSKMRL